MTATGAKELEVVGEGRGSSKAGRDLRDPRKGWDFIGFLLPYSKLPQM